MSAQARAGSVLGEDLRNDYCQQSLQPLVTMVSDDMKLLITSAMLASRMDWIWSWHHRIISLSGRLKSHSKRLFSFQILYDFSVRA